ncbi:hypothetical protein DPEC_G00112060 [Dallia pectoralis]|uniref:Uncharacterized protein n=1 Tax=Dallia pectoralis TaxID=75939 RepID=A0ACC2GTX2_DALPE|nr:hypothetical protein DPEC_G00112060 [Dallia pectoralis]
MAKTGFKLENVTVFQTNTDNGTNRKATRHSRAGVDVLREQGVWKYIRQAGFLWHLCCCQKYLNRGLPFSAKSLTF